MGRRDTGERITHLGHEISKMRLEVQTDRQGVVLLRFEWDVQGPHLNRAAFKSEQAAKAAKAAIEKATGPE